MRLCAALWLASQLCLVASASPKVITYEDLVYAAEFEQMRPKGEPDVQGAPCPPRTILCSARPGAVNGAHMVDGAHGGLPWTGCILNVH
jgi:hypothetical protein